MVSPGPIDTGLLAGMVADDGLTGKVMAGTVKAIPKGRAAQPRESPPPWPIWHPPTPASPQARSSPSQAD